MPMPMPMPMPIGSPFCRAKNSKPFHCSLIKQKYGWRGPPKFTGKNCSTYLRENMNTANYISKFCSHKQVLRTTALVKKRKQKSL